MPCHGRTGTWLCKDIVSEVRARWDCYADDWRDGWSCGFKILAPAVYIYCASALPALAFGQQLAESTDGTFTVVHVLASAALSGILQSVFGGQPLLIVGVAEPIVIIYGFMYQFLSARPDAPPFVAWSAWVCVWTAIMLVLLAVCNTGRYISYITRLSAELFGILTSILFLEQAIKGTIKEFRAPLLTDGSSSSSSSMDPPGGYITNGLWAFIIAVGLLLTALLVLSARSWQLFRPALRGFLADYGPPLMVVVWSAAAYIAAPDLPGGKPRQVMTPNTWQVKQSWSVASRMGEVSAEYVFMALWPAVLISALFWFDHGVSSLMAQQSRFGLKRPPAYSWDLLLLAAMTLACGLLGIPPVNGVLPQAPMHTHTLVTLKNEVHQAKLSRKAAGRNLESQPKGLLLKLRHVALNVVSSSQKGGDSAAGNAVSAAAAAAAAAPAAPCAAAASGATQQQWQQQQRQQEAPDHTSIVIPLGGKQQRELQLGRLDKHSSRRSIIRTITAESVAGTVAESVSGTVAESAAGLEADAEGEAGVDVRAATAESAGTESQGEEAVADAVVAVAGAAAATAESADKGLCGTWQDSTSNLQKVAVQSGGEAQREHSMSWKGDVIVVPRSTQENRLSTLLGSGMESHSAVHGNMAAASAKEEEGAEVVDLVKAQENRLSNMLQSLLLAASLGITPLIRLIPTSVLWGYFAFMALAFLDGNDMWERMVLLFMEPARWSKYRQDKEGLTNRFVAIYTVLQTACLLGIMGLVTWAGIAGVVFPVPILALVPLRIWILPRLLGPAGTAQLKMLDPREV